MSALVPFGPFTVERYVALRLLLVILYKKSGFDAFGHFCMDGHFRFLASLLRE